MDKIKNYLAKLEDLLNKILFVILDPVRSRLKKIGYLFSSPVGFIRSLLFKLALNLKKHITIILDLLNGLFGPRAYEFYKLKIQFFITTVKQSSKNSSISIPKVILKKMIFYCSEFIKSILDKITMLSPAKFGLFSVLLLVAILNMFHILSYYHHISDVVIKEKSQVNRSLASSIERIPAYYNNLARTSSIKSLKVPAQATKQSKIKSLELDVYILFNRRTSKKYFDQNMMVFVDHLEMTLEPILPSFPLTPEGKNVLRDKIAREINLVFNNKNKNKDKNKNKNNNIKNQNNIHQDTDEVEEVFFTNLFAN